MCKNKRWPLWSKDDCDDVDLDSPKEGKTVKCEECFCLLNREDAQKVEVSGFMTLYSKFYCGVHKKPYDVVRIDPFHDSPKLFFVTREIQVTESGEFVGYKKVAEKGAKSKKNG